MKDRPSRNVGPAAGPGNSALIRGDVPPYVAALKGGNGPGIQVRGSAGLIDTLLGQYLIDELRVWIFPWHFEPARNWAEPGIRSKAAGGSHKW